MNVKSKVVVIFITLFIFLPVVYLGVKEMIYRANHPESTASPAKADTTHAPLADTLHR